ncbi:MAG: PilZ domain-containing protein [Candidatus Omnitrophica bacterium]|nr:PilZ domain-containing protein [Candidatus Omnitrophota bacterium]
MDKRRALRFSTPLKVKIKKEGLLFVGTILDFSRQGFRAVFDEFSFHPQELVKLEIQRPQKDVFIPGEGKIIWIKQKEKKWEVGVELKLFPPAVKGEILDYAYQDWLKKARS